MSRASRSRAQRVRARRLNARRKLGGGLGIETPVRASDVDWVKCAAVQWRRLGDLRVERRAHVSIRRWVMGEGFGTKEEIDEWIAEEDRAAAEAAAQKERVRRAADRLGVDASGQVERTIRAGEIGS